MKKSFTRAAEAVTADGSPELSRLIRRAGKLEAVRARLERAFPEALRPHLKVANIRAKCLIVAVDSPVWAARVRYQGREILQTSSQICKTELAELKVRVRPEFFTRPDAPPRRRDGREHLDRLAASLGLRED